MLHLYYSAFCWDLMLKVNSNPFQLLHSCHSITIKTNQDLCSQLYWSCRILTSFPISHHIWALSKSSKIQIFRFVSPAFEETVSYYAAYSYSFFLFSGDWKVSSPKCDELLHESKDRIVISLGLLDPALYSLATSLFFLCSYRNQIHVHIQYLWMSSYWMGSQNISKII